MKAELTKALIQPPFLPFHRNRHLFLPCPAHHCPNHRSMQAKKITSDAQVHYLHDSNSSPQQLANSADSTDATNITSLRSHKDSVPPVHDHRYMNTSMEQSDSDHSPAHEMVTLPKTSYNTDAGLFRSRWINLVATAKTLFASSPTNSREDNNYSWYTSTFSAELQHLKECVTPSSDHRKPHPKSTFVPACGQQKHAATSTLLPQPTVAGPTHFDSDLPTLQDSTVLSVNVHTPVLKLTESGWAAVFTLESRHQLLSEPACDAVALVGKSSPNQEEIVTYKVERRFSDIEKLWSELDSEAKQMQKQNHRVFLHTKPISNHGTENEVEFKVPTFPAKSRFCRRCIGNKHLSQRKTMLQGAFQQLLEQPFAQSSVIVRNFLCNSVLIGAGAGLSN